jgi:hypothetical protein
MLLSSIALPASATPPEALNFSLDITYYNVPTSHGSGTWISTGLVQGSGAVEETYHSSGWDGCWRTVHVTSVLTGPSPEDTITLRMQTVRVQAEPGCATFTAEGNWVILSATGIYAGLHGRGGSATISGGVEPGPGNTFNFVVHSEMEGRGQFD